MYHVNPIFACDFYKVHHQAMYPKGTTKIYSNFTPRSAKLAPAGVDKVLWVGLQGFAIWFLNAMFGENFFNIPKNIVIKEYKRRMGENFNTDHIAALHDLGYLPIKIKALPEGSLVDPKVPVLTITNTHPDFAWVVNYLETALSAELWKMSTNATIAFEYRKKLEKYAKLTGSPKEFVLWQGHDFSMRGLSGVADSQVGFGHLCSFLGTDTIPAMDYAECFYNGMNTFVGGSVPATEHSVMCAGGQEDEIETYRRLITDVYPSGVVSIVSDTWDFWNVVAGPNSIAAKLKAEILGREPDAIGLAKVVFRPDSGDPVEILCGKQIREAKSIEDAEEILKESDEWQDGEEYGPCELSDLFRIDGKVFEVTVVPFWNRHDKRFYYIDGWEKTKVKEVELTAEDKGAVECLWDIFGGTITETGHKMLNQRVGLIYGDSITLARAEAILSRLAEKGFASGNVVFGIGSYTYQYNTRDTFGFAMKATYAEINDQPVELFKDPVTDSGTKKSAKGLLRVEQEDGKFVLYDQQTPAQEQEGCLQTVYMNGTLVRKTSLEEIRNKVNEAIDSYLKTVL